MTMNVIDSYIYAMNDLFSFDYFQFYSSNVTGQTGPTLTNFTSPSAAYSSNTDFISFGYYSNIINQAFYPSYWSLYSSKPGYQQWTVPKTGTYSVILCGAPGGSWLNSTTSVSGSMAGSGAVLAGSFDFNRGQNLIIQIGQSGSMWANVNPTQYTQPGRGGGGYSCIVDAADTSKPLALAAGGGGSGWTVTGQNGKRSFYLITNSSLNPSARGTDTKGGSNVAGAGWSQGSLSTRTANTWATDCNGGSNAILFDFGGFGGGGPGGLLASTSVKGGGGGGWIGGSASLTDNDGGTGGFSFCEIANVAVSPLWGQYISINQLANFVADQKSFLGGMCYIKYIQPIYNNFTITFTNCDKTGSIGPSISNIISTYSTNSNISPYIAPFPFAFKHGYQVWSVPYSTTYQITAAGASGGNCTSTSTFTGGAGQVVTTNVWLEIGDILIITVGQMGGNGTGGIGGAGGGMTTVHRNGCAFGSTANASATYKPYPIVCAAGGGGAVGNTNGGNGTFTVLTGTQTSSIPAGAGITVGAGIYATNGRQGTWDCQNDPNPSYITTSSLYGAGLYGSTGDSNGGFGGGGRGNSGFIAGGGGGFNGGFCASTSNARAFAGNSYSYYTVTSTGTNPNAHGYVTITQL